MTFLLTSVSDHFSFVASYPLFALVLAFALTLFTRSVSRSLLVLLDPPPLGTRLVIGSLSILVIPRGSVDSGVHSLVDFSVDSCVRWNHQDIDSCVCPGRNNQLFCLTYRRDCIF